MKAIGYTLFDTAIGPCGIAWGERGIVGTWLPEADEPRTRARLLRRLPGAVEADPPPDVRRAIEDITALLFGRTARPLRDRSRPRARFGVSAPRVRDRQGDSARSDTHVRGNRLEPRRSFAGARSRPGARPESVSDRRSLSPRSGRERKERRILRSGRRLDEAAASRDRGRAGDRNPDPLLTGRLPRH